MRVFVAGASGAIGARLVPQLIEAGHEVIGTFMSPSSASACGRSARSRSPSTCSTRGQCAERCSEPSPRRSSTRRPRWRTRASPGTWTAAWRRTGSGPRASTRCWLPRARPACAGSWPRASPSMRYAREGGPVKTEEDPRPEPAGGDARDRSRDAPSRPGGHRRRRNRAAPASTAPPTTEWSSRCAGGSFRSSATAAAFRRSSTSTTPRPRPCSHSSVAPQASTTSPMTSPPRCASGCRCSRRRWARSRRGISPAGSRLFAGQRR